MNREIKFRAWNGEKMIANVAVRNGFFIYAQQTSGNDYWDVKYIEVPEYQVTQFTGLKDHNGKEIYEGDICRCYFTDNSNNAEIGFVTFENCAFRLSNGIVDNTIKWNLTDYYDIEVIGNIYENIGLLNNE